MNIIETKIPDVLVIEPTVYEDDRGFFYESYNKQRFHEATGVECDFVQDNHSRSTKNVLRGMHYQINNPQGKLVRVVSGEVFDVAVDIRRSSPTFGEWVGVKLSEHNKRQLWVPEGFAHGFLVTSLKAEFLYKTTNYYMREGERCIHWADSDLAIEWPITDEVHVSEKDRQGVPFKAAEMFA
jgi:dTDP-4-dehydrorhamnose 3,5-epimerase